MLLYLYCKALSHQNQAVCKTLNMSVNNMFVKQHVLTEQVMSNQFVCLLAHLFCLFVCLVDLLID